MKKILLLVLALTLSGCQGWGYGDGGYPWSNWFDPPAAPCGNSNSSCSW